MATSIPVEGTKGARFPLSRAMCRRHRGMARKISRLPLTRHITGDGTKAGLCSREHNRRGSPRYAAEEAECGVVPVAKRFGGFRRVGLHKAGVAMRQVDRKEVDLALYPGNLRHRLAKVRLRMAGIMPQRYEDLELPQSACQYVVLNNGDPAGIAVLVAKPLEDPL